MDMHEKTILVVDDDVDIRDVVCDMVQDYGFKTITASSGKEALEVIQADRPPIVILDLVMPIMSGMECLKCIVKDYPDTYVIILTGFDDPTSHDRCIELGAHAFIEKPVDEDYLEIILRRFSAALEQKKD